MHTCETSVHLTNQYYYYSKNYKMNKFQRKAKINSFWFNFQWDLTRCEIHQLEVKKRNIVSDFEHDPHFSW